MHHFHSLVLPSGSISLATVSLVLAGLSTQSLAAETGAAANVSAAQVTETAPRALSPTQLSAIRSLGRNVLVARKSGGVDTADAEQLARLRTTVNALITVDLEPSIRAGSSMEAQEGGEQRVSRERIAVLRDSTRADARALAAQLRQRGGLLASRARSGSDTASAGARLAGQRAQVFERVADKLDTALSGAEPDRVARLTELRDQIAPRSTHLLDAPHLSTPTLQAMPSDSATPIRAVSASKANPRKRQVK